MKKVVIFIAIISSLFGFQNIQGEDASNYIVGKVVKAYTNKGLGRWGREWLFMDVKTGGKVFHVALAPTFKLPNIGINEGDEVKIKWFRPTSFPPGYVKAVEIYDITQKKSYSIARLVSHPQLEF